MAIESFNLSSVVKSALVDRNGDKLGRVEDLIVKLGDNPHPPLSGLVVRIGQRSLFVPIDRIADIRPGRVDLVGDTVNLQRFERRPGELLLDKDLLARHLIKPPGRPPDPGQRIEIARLDGRWEIVGVDPTPRVALDACCALVGPAHPHPDGHLVDWASIEPFVAHVPTARLRIPYRKLARLHPARSPTSSKPPPTKRARRSSRPWAQDRELEADVFEELERRAPTGVHPVPIGRRGGPACSPPWPPTMPPTCSPSSTRSDGSPSCRASPPPSSARSGPCSAYNSETAGVS